MKRVSVVRAGLGLAMLVGLALAPRASGQTGDANGDTGGRRGPVAEALQQDLQRLHASNRAEIRAAQIAQRRGLSAAVVELARLIEQENRRIEDELQGVAERLQVDLEGNAYDDEIQKQLKRADDQLGTKEGQAFDQAYATLLVRDQREDLNRNLTRWIDDAMKAGDTRLAEGLQRVRTTMEERLALAERVQDLEQRQSNLQKPGATGGVQSETSTSAIGDDRGAARGTSPAGSGR